MRLQLETKKHGTFITSHAPLLQIQIYNADYNKTDTNSQ